MGPESSKQDHACIRASSGKVERVALEQLCLQTGASTKGNGTTGGFTVTAFICGQTAVDLKVLGSMASDAAKAYLLCLMARSTMVNG